MFSKFSDTSASDEGSDEPGTWSPRWFFNAFRGWMDDLSDNMLACPTPIFGAWSKPQTPSGQQQTATPFAQTTIGTFQSRDVATQTDGITEMRPAEPPAELSGEQPSEVHELGGDLVGHRLPELDSDLAGHELYELDSDPVDRGEMMVDSPPRLSLDDIPAARVPAGWGPEPGSPISADSEVVDSPLAQTVEDQPKTWSWSADSNDSHFEGGVRPPVRYDGFQPIDKGKQRVRRRRSARQNTGAGWSTRQNHQDHQESRQDGEAANQTSEPGHLSSQDTQTRVGRSQRAQQESPSPRQDEEGRRDGQHPQQEELGFRDYAAEAARRAQGKSAQETQVLTAGIPEEPDPALFLSDRAPCSLRGLAPSTSLPPAQEIDPLLDAFGPASDYVPPYAQQTAIPKDPFEEFFASARHADCASGLWYTLTNDLAERTELLAVDGNAEAPEEESDEQTGRLEEIEDGVCYLLGLTPPRLTARMTMHQMSSRSEETPSGAATVESGKMWRNPAIEAIWTRPKEFLGSHDRSYRRTAAHPADCAGSKCVLESNDQFEAVQCTVERSVAPWLASVAPPHGPYYDSFYEPQHEATRVFALFEAPKEPAAVVEKLSESLWQLAEEAPELTPTPIQGGPPQLNLELPAPAPFTQADTGTLATLTLDRTARRRHQRESQDNESVSTTASQRARIRFGLNSGAQSWQPISSKSTASLGVNAGMGVMGQLSLSQAVSTGQTRTVQDLGLAKHLPAASNDDPFVDKSNGRMRTESTKVKSGDDWKPPKMQLPHQDSAIDLWQLGQALCDATSSASPGDADDELSDPATSPPRVQRFSDSENTTPKAHSAPTETTPRARQRVSPAQRVASRPDSPIQSPNSPNPNRPIRVSHQRSRAVDLGRARQVSSPYRLSPEQEIRGIQSPR